MLRWEAGEEYARLLQALLTRTISTAANWLQYGVWSQWHIKNFVCVYSCISVFLSFLTDAQKLHDHHIIIEATVHVETNTHRSVVGVTGSSL